MDYKKAGVDIEAGYKSVELMKEHIKKTMRPEVLTNIGGFSGAFSGAGEQPGADSARAGGAAGDDGRLHEHGDRRASAHVHGHGEGAHSEHAGQDGPAQPHGAGRARAGERAGDSGGGIARRSREKRAVIAKRKRVRGAEACRAQRVEHAGGASGNEQPDFFASRISSKTAFLFFHTDNGRIVERAKICDLHKRSASPTAALLSQSVV